MSWFVVRLFACTIVLCHVAFADEFVAVRQLIKTRMAEEEIPSVVVGVVRGEKVLWEEAFGWADRENQVPATIRTAYCIGSTTKPVTATAVMTLVGKGELSLDQPINEFLLDTPVESYVGSANDATLRRMLHHTSGLPGHWQTYFPEETASRPSLEALIDRYAKIMIPPAEQFHYSNLGYALLGEIVARCSDKSFDEYLQQDVFAPLGMHDSFLAVGDISATRRAAGYRANGDRIDHVVTTVSGAADVYSSVHDLLRFGMFHNKSGPSGQSLELCEALIDEMQQATVPMGSEEYGLGWHVRTDLAGRRHVLHGGAHVGWECHVDMIPDEKLCVVVLANKDVKWPGYRIALAVTDAIYSAILDCPVEQVQPKGGHDLGFSPENSVGLPGKLSGNWVGAVHTHDGKIPVSLTFHEDGDVHAKLRDGLIALVNEARLDDNGNFTGRMLGDLGTPDSLRRTHDLQWHASVRDGKLVGILYAVGTDPSGPGSGRGLYLAHWIQLERDQQTK
ncbi:MAG: serine hydrolase domain-containing protein [Pirellulales bacterium]